MSIEVKVPVLPESVADATVAAWHKKVGDKVSRDENLVDLETDKVVLEVPSPVDGVLSDILFNTGDTVGSGDLLAKISQSVSVESQKTEKEEKPVKKEEIKISESESVSTKEDKSTSPVVRRMMAENDL
ncbi:TPA: biotin/lipoyl-containing protein, partial [Legionella pneumophila]